jgi:5-methylthioadenosine/S-adenosylhomocysteine deaminase
MIRGVPQYGSVPLMTALGATNSETVKVGSTSFLLNITDSDPDVPVVLLADAKARLSEALQNLPQLQTQPAPAASRAAVGTPVWTLELDELEHTAVEMRPRLPMGSKLTGTARPQKAEVPPKLKPLDLDGLTVVDDPQFLKVLKQERNLPSGLAAAVAAFYGQ